MNIEEIYQIYLKYPSIQTDTRKLKNGDIYVALKGEHFDGNRFAEDALKKGAAYAIIDNPALADNPHFIYVENCLGTLQKLANFHRRQFDIPFIAITGSNGKTTTKELVNIVLSTSYRTYATEGNLNNHIGIPLTLLKIKKDAQIAIIEMGANHQQEIASYCQIAEPTHALINNCGRAHLEGFGGIEGVRKGKGELYDYIKKTNGTIYINHDLDYLTELAKGIQHQISYGSQNAQYIGKVYQNNPFLKIAILNSNNEILIHSHLVGEYNFPNIMAAVAIGRSFNISIEKIKEAIQNYTPDNSRSQLIQRGTNTIILDAYNANPSSMSLAIQNFAMTDYPNKTVIIGAMMELGKSSIEEHQNIISLLEQYHWNQVILVGGDFKFVKHSFQFFENIEAATFWFYQQKFAHQAFLIKGSRAFTMEKILNNPLI
ncbi:MAG: UDP-N-acetylmuramoyl-tripeptide--D-alanyl-D-alanine ligase [Chitinophagaceae bacterium]|nr:MAG: UDP-N-acetylmuramoyl-tripeptide--D-alanyl-D- alanine ligase [Bacteroidetes bacterium OLB11]MCC6448574.1 UDP-N-acetylmuramoyl-tripeptide--D-alanyl-D-alanine ligase [Chitinophagaceae bacterium]HMN32248.1 UDP-N-acetylmuramoyl-tripeptide--D-alanyl-D-alanine ligase [Chitinophagaceae bacterium]